MIRAAAPCFRFSTVAAWLATACAVTMSAAARAGEEPSLEADKQALAPLQPYVGQWRGVGLPKRGSNQGAWTEQSQWAWRFTDGRAELVGELDGDKYFDRLEIRPGDKPGAFDVLAAAEQVSEEAGGGGPAHYRGEVTDGRCASRPTGPRPTLRRGSPCGWSPAAIECSCCTKRNSATACSDAWPKSVPRAREVSSPNQRPAVRSAS